MRLYKRSAGGSPPRAWGQCHVGTSARSSARFTPTGVGTMRPRSRAPSSGTVHPHGRGDNERSGFARTLERGSPPRAWGQCRCRFACCVRVRFTPTGVGTINRTITHHATHAVHPHGRGDNYLQQHTVPYTTVHPHGRGDNAKTGAKSRQKRGSPPRAWGQLVAIVEFLHCNRFTPTGVGTMSASCCRPCSRTVHPHGRGDNFTYYDRRPAGDGSPPRAWGQYRGVSAGDSVVRFTPTGVGTMATGRWSKSRIKVHPHGRGDNQIAIPCPRDPGGSPPRAWGQ